MRWIEDRASDSASDRLLAEDLRELLLVIALDLTAFDALTREEARGYLLNFLRNRREEEPA